jgi:hypothetical protein
MPASILVRVDLRSLRRATSPVCSHQNSLALDRYIPLEAARAELREDLFS